MLHSNVTLKEAKCNHLQSHFYLQCLSFRGIQSALCLCLSHLLVLLGSLHTHAERLVALVALRTR